MIRINIVGAALVWCVSASSLVTAESPSVRPAAGKTYSYGVQLIVRPLTRSAFTVSQYSYRWKVEYDVQSADSDGWTATFRTMPFGTYGPRTNTIDFDGRAPKAVEDPIQVAADATAEERQSAAFLNHRYRTGRQRSMQIREAQLLSYRAFPSLVNPQTGTVRVSALGEVLESTTSTALPLLAGSLATIPIVRLPGQDTDRWSERSVTSVPLIQPDDDYTGQTTDVAVLTALTREVSKDPDIFAARFDRELLGGGAELRDLKASGQGVWQFSQSRGMAFQGDQQLQTQGMILMTSHGKHRVHVGFQLLEGWREELFDRQLTPTEDGLSENHLPALTAAQQQAWRELYQAERQKLSFSSDVLQLREVAAPPLDSPLRELMTAWVVDQPKGLARNHTKLVLEQWSRMEALAKEIPRSWTDDSGEFAIRALLLGRRDSDIELKRLDNGKTILVPISRLSEPDRKYAQRWAR